MLNVLIKFFKGIFSCDWNREQQEAIHKALIYKYRTDESITESERDKLDNIIDLGGNTDLYEWPDRKNYWKQAQIYSDIIRENKIYWNDVDALYEKFKEALL